MVLNDPLANALNVVWNAEKIGKSTCTIKPISKIITSVFEIMKGNGYLKSLTTVEDGRGNFYTIALAGTVNQCGVIKPRHAVQKGNFEKFEQRYLPAKGMGILIVSTPQGMMTHYEAKEKSIGGRLIAYCY
ncbi:30S ribosomal protein S8 [Candidatus Woesearchaeota archaeon CG_4_10_14_0_8_um_filter_47_5]|nr:MAG: 30S ribosomal protein S8 [Candidatus Woesearchaeota archaeon CG_4_10_14_0_8_um_filter_47_5]